MSTTEKRVDQLRDGELMLIGTQTPHPKRVRVHSARRTTDCGIPSIEVLFSFVESPCAGLDTIIYGAKMMVTVVRP